LNSNSQSLGPIAVKFKVALRSGWSKHGNILLQQ